MSSAPNQPQHRTFTPRRHDGPRKVRHGIKLAGLLDSDGASNGTAGAIPGHGLARRLLALVEAKAPSQQWSEGVEYAKAGQVVSVQLTPGAIEGRVQGTLPQPCLARVSLPMLKAPQWEQLIAAMAAEAMYVAKLLAGELPSGLEELMASLKLAFLPESADLVQVHCSCSEMDTAGTTSSNHSNSQSLHPKSSACKHAVALTHIAAEQLAINPLLYFTVLGLSAEQLIARLQDARLIEGSAESGLEEHSVLPDVAFRAPPLEACVEDFWRSPMRGEEWDELESRLPRQHVAHALLRRMGPSPLSGRFPMVGLLASVYDVVAASAKRMRETPE